MGGLGGFFGEMMRQANIAEQRRQQNRDLALKMMMAGFMPRGESMGLGMDESPSALQAGGAPGALQEPGVQQEEEFNLAGMPMLSPHQIQTPPAPQAGSTAAPIPVPGQEVVAQRPVMESVEPSFPEDLPQEQEPSRLGGFLEKLTSGLQAGLLGPEELTAESFDVAPWNPAEIARANRSAENERARLDRQDKQRQHEDDMRLGVYRIMGDYFNAARKAAGKGSKSDDPVEIIKTLNELNQMTDQMVESLPQDWIIGDDLGMNEEYVWHKVADPESPYYNERAAAQIEFVINARQALMQKAQRNLESQLGSSGYAPREREKRGPFSRADAIMGTGDQLDQQASEVDTAERQEKSLKAQQEQFMQVLLQELLRNGPNAMPGGR